MVQFRKRKSDGQSFPVGTNRKIRANNPSNDVGGIKIGKGIRTPQSITNEEKQELRDWVKENPNWKSIDDLPNEIFIPLIDKANDDIDKRVKLEVKVIEFMKSVTNKLPPIKDNSGNILDSGNRLEDIKEAEVRKRVDDFVEDEDSFIEELNQSEPPLESMGVTVEAGDFLKENDEIAFREALNNTADSRTEDFRSNIESEIDEEESLKQSRYIPL